MRRWSANNRRLRSTRSKGKINYHDLNDAASGRRYGRGKAAARAGFHGLTRRLPFVDPTRPAQRASWWAVQQRAGAQINNHADAGRRHHGPSNL